MSKYVKNLVSEHLRRRLVGVQDALMVNVVGLPATADHRLRGELEAKRINLLVVKNSLASRAVVGTPLAPMFEGVTGTAAICWGEEDIVSLAKEIARLAANKEYAAFEARSGVMDGERLSAEQVLAVSRWPSRAEQLSLLVGQILSPGATLAAQLSAPGGALASQVAQKAEEPEADGAS